MKQPVRQLYIHTGMTRILSTTFKIKFQREYKIRIRSESKAGREVDKGKKQIKRKLEVNERERERGPQGESNVECDFWGKGKEFDVPCYSPSSLTGGWVAGSFML